MKTRNEQLLERVASHPLLESLKEALATSEKVSAATARIRGNQNLSVIGRQKEVEQQARAALRDFRDVKAKVDEIAARRAALQSGVSKPVFDRTDLVGGWNRGELRSLLASLSTAERMKLVVEDRAFRDAALEQPPIVSGFRTEGDLVVYKDLQAKQVEELHGPRLYEIAALDEQLDQANAVLQVVRGDLRHEMSLDQLAFNTFAKPIETRASAPWLMRQTGSDGTDRIMTVDMARFQEKRSDYVRPATVDEARDGKFYADHAAYVADRGAA